MLWLQNEGKASDSGEQAGLQKERGAWEGHCSLSPATEGLGDVGHQGSMLRTLSQAEAWLIWGGTNPRLSHSLWPQFSSPPAPEGSRSDPALGAQQEGTVLFSEEDAESLSKHLRVQLPCPHCFHLGPGQHPSLPG